MGEAKQKVPPVADRLVYYVREAEWPLFVDQHAEAHTFVGGQAVPISRANRALTELLYQHEEKAPSNDGLIGARRVLDMLAHKSGEVRELHTRAAFHEGALFYELAPGRVEPGAERRGLAEVPAEPHAAHPRVGLGQHTDLLPRAVGGAVVDEHDVEVISPGLRDGVELGMELCEALVLVECGDDDGKHG